LICTDPYMTILRQSNASLLFVRISRHSLQDPCTSQSIMMADHERRIVINDAHIDAPVESRLFFVCDPDSNIWGLGIEQNNTSKIEVWRFKQHMPKAGVEFRLLQLHLVLSGDVEFLHTVLGLQSCNATFPCYR
jgi:hypothetical protein